MHKTNMASKLNLLSILAVKLLQTKTQPPQQNALAAGMECAMKMCAVLYRSWARS